jgi:hypothetical protein
MELISVSIISLLVHAAYLWNAHYFGRRWWVWLLIFITTLVFWQLLFYKLNLSYVPTILCWIALLFAGKMFPNNIVSLTTKEENLRLSPAQFSQLREQRFKDAKILIEFRERISTQARSDINKNLYIVTGNKRFTRPWYSITSDDGLISKISSEELEDLVSSKTVKLLVEFRKSLFHLDRSIVNKALFVITGDKQFTRPWYNINADHRLISKLSDQQRTEVLSLLL